MKKQLILSVLMLCSLPLLAQVSRSDDFHQRYKLKEVVIFSRHNARSPITDGSSSLGRMTPNTWTSWSSDASELTLRGGVLETQNGQFFRKWVVSEGLLPENARPASDEVRIYANGKQRTIATARYFTSGFMPVSDVLVERNVEFNKTDPVFNLLYDKVPDYVPAIAQQQLVEKFGEDGLTKISKSLKSNYELLAEVLDLKHSDIYTSGELTGFEDYTTKLYFKDYEEPLIDGSLNAASSAADALLLQSYEETDPLKAGFGHELTDDQWRQIATIKYYQNDVRFCLPVIANHFAYNILGVIRDELQRPDRKFTLLVGHDTNITCLLNALKIEMPPTTNSIEPFVPIGSKIVFEKWVDASGNEYVGINHVYQSTSQIRHQEMLFLSNPPMMRALTVDGLTANADGLYSLADVIKQIDASRQSEENVANGITPAVSATSNASAAKYSIAGQQISQAAPGQPYIVSGKKFVN